MNSDLFVPVDASRALMQVMRIDIDSLDKDCLLTISSYIFYNECGLAYDALTFLIREGTYRPSVDALRLIKISAEMLGVEFPNLSC